MSQQGILADSTSPDMDIETLTGNTGGAVGPDGAFNINIVGSAPYTVSGDPGTHTLTITDDGTVATQYDGDSGSAVPALGILNILGAGTVSTSGSGNTITISSSASGYPITPYVVGPIGEAGYQTIQDGLDAANAAGGGIVGVQPGTYTEDLTLYDNTQVVGFCSPGTVSAGSGGNEPVIITGTHTPPTSGFFAFKNIAFTSSGSVISSAAGGIATIQVDSCAVGAISGYLFDLDNWTGEISLINSVNKFTGNRGINNSTGATVYVLNSELGSIGASSSNLGGTNVFKNSTLNAPIAFLDGSDTTFNNSSFLAGFTTAGSCTVVGSESLIQNSGGSAITHGSSDTLDLTNSTITSSTNPSIAGAGSGTISLAGVDFLNNNNIAGTLTVTGRNSYSGIYKSDYTDHGVILGQGTATNMVATAAGTDGQVLIGATGADPAFATLTSTGGTVTFTPGANSLNVEAGGGAVATSYSADSGSAVPAAGVLTIIGSGGITTTGSGSTITINGSGEQVITITALDNTDSPYTVLTTDYYMSCDVSGGVLTIRMPDAPTTGKVFIVKDANGDAFTSNITVTTVGGAVTIDGATSYVMNVDYQSAQFVFNGSSYEIF